jgi:hypothetical protein
VVCSALIIQVPDGGFEAILAADIFFGCVTRPFDGLA